MKWYYWIIKQKIIIIIKWVRWPAVLSCDWWLDFVAAVTSAVWGKVGSLKRGKKWDLAKPGKKENPRNREMGPSLPPSRGLGNITSSTILSCTVICSRQNPRLYCTVLGRAQYSPVLYSTGLNCKATIVFPFRNSRKMPLSRLDPREIDIFSCQRRRESNNQCRLIDCLISGLRNWFTIRTQIVGESISQFESNVRRCE